MMSYVVRKCRGVVVCRECEIIEGGNIDFFEEVLRGF